MQTVQEIQKKASFLEVKSMQYKNDLIHFDLYYIYAKDILQTIHLRIPLIRTFLCFLRFPISNELSMTISILIPKE